MKRVLVTGASGFVGVHLLKYLLNFDLEIWGTTRVPYVHSFDDKRVKWVELELADYAKVKEVVSLVEPDYIFHLAGQSNVRFSWEDKAETFQSNVIGTIHLLESIREICPEAIVITVGSSEEYGMVTNQEIAIPEETTPNPMNPYGISKLTVSSLAQQFSKTYGMRVIHVRPFNHIGPGQSLGFVTADFASQIVSIEKGIKENPILVGNLSARRDFTDVRDIVRAYWDIAQRGKVGNIYNVCSGVGIEIDYIVRELANRSREKIEIEQDPSRFRPMDVPLYIGDNTKIKEHAGWKPKIRLEQTLDDIIEDWRYRLSL